MVLGHSIDQEHLSAGQRQTVEEELEVTRALATPDRPTSIRARLRAPFSGSRHKRDAL